ncbi:remorin [Salvia miltiorrhiza]|uniref:remorin n=1 Tax=Salvia miltiorrhiza TaxID=226208 RepID=UPI0025AC08E3|nr:remorin [Salvia miltiorrhiza]XP_057776926.1 remorin [Salvia miltiorrhiza]XP_057776928.1 remorin [Salvia miltiorrhiza]
MRSIEDKGCLTQEVGGGGSCMSFEFKSNGLTLSRSASHTLGKPTPSKWDDAQKWLVNLSKNPSKASPRNSNADDRRLIVPPVPKKDYPSGDEDDAGADQFDVETKTVDCDESVWRINRPSKSVVRSVCVRDMGTEMTPIASQEPSRTATPIRATTPAARSPVSSGTSTPVRSHSALLVSPVTATATDDSETTANPLETRAAAWDEAERAKYMARFKREEVKIQAWENHEKRKAEMQMRKVEVKAERLKSRAQEKYSNKLAASRRIAEEKRANAEAELNEKAVKTSQRADYIRRTGHLPSSFSFKLPSLCW